MEGFRIVSLNLGLEPPDAPLLPPTDVRPDMDLCRWNEAP